MLEIRVRGPVALEDADRLGLVAEAAPAATVLPTTAPTLEPRSLTGVTVGRPVDARGPRAAHVRAVIVDDDALPRGQPQPGGRAPEDLRVRLAHAEGRPQDHRVEQRGHLVGHLVGVGDQRGRDARETCSAHDRDEFFTIGEHPAVVHQQPAQQQFNLK